MNKFATTGLHPKCVGAAFELFFVQALLFEPVFVFLL